MLVAGVSVFLTAGWCAVKKTRPVRYIRALRIRTFPGRLRRLDEEEIGTESEWLG
jgi:hypothetical protein